MRPIAPIVLACLLALSAAIPAPVHADEPNGEDSAAARLFREGWWLETGAGALDKAAGKYEAALAAEGSVPIRARALYRLGVVQQRMGRTEEGIQALERLTKEFASQSKLLAEAKKRLEEWTGTDLKDSFGEWYRRYQYSPEFQAKVIDLVLKLGSSGYKVRNAAEQELLTIGEPAVPALRAHAASGNTTLAKNAVGLLLHLRVVPPAEALVKTTSWTQREHQIALVLERDRATSVGLMKALAGDERPAARALRAAAEGRLVFVRHVLDEDPASEPVLPALLPWATDTEDVPAELLERLRALAKDPAAHTTRRAYTIRALHPERGHVAAKMLHALALETTDETLRKEALRVAGTEGLDRSDLWRVYASLIRRAAAGSQRGDWTRALLWALKHAPEDVRLDEAVQALAPALDSHTGYVASAFRSSGSGVYEGNPAGRRLLRRLIVDGMGRQVPGFLTTWTTQAAGDEPLGPMLLAWSGSARSEDVQRQALQQAAMHWRGDVAPLVAAVSARTDLARVGRGFFKGLRSNAGLTTLPWTQDALASLVEIAEDTAMTTLSVQRGGTIQKVTSFSSECRSTFVVLLHSDRVRPRLIALMVRAPRHVPKELVTGLPHTAAQTEDGAPVGLDLLRRHWTEWEDAGQKLAALELFGESGLNPAGKSALEPFARSQLAKGREANPFAVRRALLALVPRDQRTLEQVRITYDFGVPKQLAEAVRTTLPALPPDEATYRAFAPALEPGTSHDVASAFDNRFTKSLQPGGPLAHLTQRHLERLLARGDHVGATHAIRILQARNSTEDIALWHRLLAHESAEVRLRVATQLGSLYTGETIGHLARLVDDPNPTVRDAALTSLERIKEIEEQKDYWRKFAADKAK